MGVYATYLAAGLAAGFTSALLGIGGGVIMTPVLVILFSLQAQTATATSLVFIVPIAVAGALLAWSHGDVPRWDLLMLAVPMGVAGAFLGRWTSNHISGAHVKLAFALLMIIVSVQLGVDGLRSLKNAPPAQPAPTATNVPPADHS